MSRLLSQLSRPAKCLYSAGVRAMRPLRRIGLTLLVLGSVGIASTAMATPAHANTSFIDKFVNNMPADPFNAENPANDLKAIHFECLNCPAGATDPGEPLAGSGKAGYVLAGTIGTALLLMCGAGAVGRRRSQLSSDPAPEAPTQAPN